MSAFRYWRAGPVAGEGGLRAVHGLSSTPLPRTTRARSGTLEHLSSGALYAVYSHIKRTGTEVLG
jgi:hypothetical protein